MTTDYATLPIRHPISDGTPRHPLTGLGTLIALALRRDRFRICMWVGWLTLLMTYTPLAFKSMYPTSTERMARVTMMKTPAGIIMGGPNFGINETDIGVMVASELMTVMIAAAAIMSILTVIRHTRAEEESGAAELVMSAVVGHQTRTYAALIVVGLMNAVLAVAMTLALSAAGFDVADSLGISFGITGASMIFAGISAVTSQLWRTSRAASGVAMAALAASVVVRGLGDIIDNKGSALSWFSPLAWAQQMRPFVDLRWWPFLLLVGTTLALILTAHVLEGHRQYDAGVLPSRGENPNALTIRSVFGLNLQLQRGLLAGWGIGVFLGGMAFGSMAKSLRDSIDTNPLLARAFKAHGLDSIFATFNQVLAIAVTAYVVSAIVKLTKDEQSGIAEAVLARAVSRWNWLLSAVGVTALGSVLLMVIAGVGGGLGAAAALHNPELVWRLTLAGLAQIPALLVISGIAAVAVAVRQTWIGWLTVALSVGMLYAGILQLPAWMVKLSPVMRVSAPVEYPWFTMFVLVVIGAGLIAAAGNIYRRRDAI
ncbi:ABC transporter [Mycobacterium sp. CBMA271]|uniref:ABC transporter permease n=1 Tax=unclassified Mycobacteroides TaxID=2618759 RepID=UPI001329D0B7|nr:MULTISPECIES: ABC transporter [unclassified Mycobacteroides]MUM16596.1 ABC transporter [Mycobacteroides sp. CBMA 326]MUM22096.1 ABC transporter [Mycobacteroides sp. CBMA 271]